MPRSKLIGNLQVQIDGNDIEQVKRFKYLGLILNETLNFETHYQNVSKNMTSRLFMLNRYKGYFTFKWRQIFVTSLVLSLAEFCLPIWGNVSETKFKYIRCKSNLNYCFENFVKERT